MKIAQDKHLGEEISALFDSFLARGRQQAGDEFRQSLGSLLASTSSVKRAPVSRNVTILMSDIRGFTAFAEKYPDTKIVELLNHYFAVMGNIIYRHGGSIDKPRIVDRILQ